MTQLTPSQFGRCRPRLNPRDIKGIANDRNVPEPVRKQAQKFVKGQQQHKK